MEQSFTEKKAHPFFDKHTVLGTIVLILWGYFIVMIPASFVIGIVAAILKLEDITHYLCFGVFIMAGVTLLIHKVWFKPELKGILFRGFLRTLRCCPVILPYWLLLLLPDLLKGEYPHTFNLEVFSLAFTAGVSEELIFRGLPGSYLKRQLRTENKVPLIVCITGVIFGLTHVTNMFFGASVSASLVQGITTSCIGIFLGAVFIRGGNILVPMLLHSLHDMLILSFQDADEVSAVVEREADLGDIPTVLLCMALAVYGFFLVRKSKRGEICEMWAETWSQTNENQPAEPAASETINGGTI